MNSGSTVHPEALSAVKARVRDRYRKLREAMTPAQVRAASEALCRRLAAWDVLQNARQVMAYIAFRNELDLVPLFGMLPAVRWIVPRVTGKQLVLHPYEPARLVRHRFGMLEPAADLPVVAPDTLDVVLVPGVAFDRQGGRMGFGGGFYDAFLPTTGALRVGITFDDCLADRVPGDAHDQRMDWVVTPHQTLRVSEPDGSRRPARSDEAARE
jgi:5-formyltetrahydrofolate cyclo-ligase